MTKIRAFKNAMIGYQYTRAQIDETTQIYKSSQYKLIKSWK